MDKDFIKLEKQMKKLNKKDERIINHENKKSKKKYDEKIRLENMTDEERKIYDSNTPPQRSVLEEIGNSVTHGVGAILAIIALVFMLLYSNYDARRIVASLIYGISMFLMLLMSCLYHAFPSKSKVKRLFRRFDYTGIYLQIGGTFAPLLLVFLAKPEYQSLFPLTFEINNFYVYFGLGVCIFQWLLIALGITMTSIFGPGRVKKLNFILYFAIGWSGLMFIPHFVICKIELLWMILFGGIAYTLGMIPFAIKKIPATHFVWHFFVLAGAVIQYLGILLFVYM